MNLGLKGKTVLVTGASRNMGKVTTLMFAQEGANLAICTSSKLDELNEVAETARSMGVTVYADQCDVSNRDDVDIFVSKASTQFGGIDVAVNLVGHRCNTDVLELSQEEWDRNIAVNLSGTFNVCRSVVPSMIARKWGRIINIAGVAPYTGGGAAKAMVKLGIVGFTRGLAAEFAEHKITANCVGPGTIERQEEADVKQHQFDAQPIKRAGDQKEVASLIMYLASEGASYITGQCYLINGGRYFQ